MKRQLLSNKTIFRGIMAAFLSLASVTMSAQQVKGTYTVKKGETLFAIAKRNGVTIDEITNVNPAMKAPNYVLKVGAVINIPVPGQQAQTAASTQAASTPASSTPTPSTPVPSTPAVTPAAPKVSATSADVAKNTITVGFMLPLHDINGDGRRMLEFYRGMLLAMNDLKREGYNIEMNAWNVPDNADVKTVLRAQKASQCDVIFGPLYTKQVPEMASFCQQHNIRLVIPFSISGNDVEKYPCIYQVYQSPSVIDAKAINDFMSLFQGSHPVFVDCNDASSGKGTFTAALRVKLDKAGVKYSITNSKNNAAMFAKAFVADRKNVVILNTGRSPELGQVFKLLDQLTAANPAIQVSMFGYNEWFMYSKVYQDKFKKYDVYVPSVYDYNTSSASIRKIENDYIAYFGQPMQQSIPRFALTGYDQLMFFVKGINEYGAQFHGLASQNKYTAVQTPYSFQKVGNGGYQNNTFMLVRYK